jgi:putative membrane protein
MDVHRRDRDAAPVPRGAGRGEYLLYRAVTGGESDSDQAMEELRLAYARGDLTDEEYEQPKTALERDT